MRRDAPKTDGSKLPSDEPGSAGRYVHYRTNKCPLSDDGLIEKGFFEQKNPFFVRGTAVEQRIEQLKLLTP